MHVHANEHAKADAQPPSATPAAALKETPEAKPESQIAEAAPAAWEKFSKSATVSTPLEPHGSALLPDGERPSKEAAAKARAEAAKAEKLERFKFALAQARFAVNTHDFPGAEKNFLLLLAEDAPEEMQKTALFEMGVAVQTQNDLPRAQSILTQYTQRWPGDARSPEINLHQGQIFRSMGMNQLALAKFYSVMTTALTIKNEQLPYFKRLVLQAQVEIAETFYLVGRFAEAAEYYSRLLKQQQPELDLAQIQFRLIRSLTAQEKFEAAGSQAQDYLARYAASPEAPEVRYHLAKSLKAQNRNSEALQQVMIFLKEQRELTRERPEVWTYWQQRVGNDIGNQLYQEGDFVKALEVYQTLAKLDTSPAWQLPVNYQVAITYEKLLQPASAIATYRSITNLAPQLGTNAAPGLKSVLDMARWRLDFLQFQSRAEAFVYPENSPATPKPAPNLSRQ